MKNSAVWLCFVISIFVLPCTLAAWTFTEVNAPGSSDTDEILDSGIAWRPQGDYALIVRESGLYRYESSSGNLTYQSHSGKYLYRVAWSLDGSYALISGYIHLYRYEHAPAGFGTLTELTDIEGYSTYTITFYDIVFNPADVSDPPYIATNREISPSKQIVMYLYDPENSPQVYWDFSGGTTPVIGAGEMSFSPVSMAFEAHGDYIVIANRYGEYSQGLLVYDPDNSTFPKETSGAMQYYEYIGDIGNANTVCMNPNPVYLGNPFVLLKGNGTVMRLVQQSLPATFVENDPGGGWYTSIMGGDSSYSWDGSCAIFLERQEWTPNHKFMTFSSDGSWNGLVDILGITNRTVRLYAVAWHPNQNMGLMGGENGWIIRFSSTNVVTATPTITPTATETPTSPPTETATPSPTPVPVPATSAAGISSLFIIFGLLLFFKKMSTSRQPN